jgi:hypothetical protein
VVSTVCNRTVIRRNVQHDVTAAFRASYTLESACSVMMRYGMALLMLTHKEEVEKVEEVEEVACREASSVLLLCLTMHQTYRFPPP